MVQTGRKLVECRSEGRRAEGLGRRAASRSLGGRVGGGGWGGEWVRGRGEGCQWVLNEVSSRGGGCVPDMRDGSHSGPVQLHWGLENSSLGCFGQSLRLSAL
jgi:hypothetical protein